MAGFQPAGAGPFGAAATCREPVSARVKSAPGAGRGKRGYAARPAEVSGLARPPLQPRMTGNHEEPRVRPRLRAPARALVLFAARRRADDRQARRAREGRPPAGARADRHRQHVRCARILRQAGGQRASSRSSAARWRSISATRRRRAIRAMRSSCRALVLLAAREDGYRNLMRLTSRAFLETPSGEPPHLKLAALEAAPTA